MTTVLSYLNSNGDRGRRDAKCHNARPGSDCDCICQGKNHGAGSDQAMENARTMAGD